MTDSSLRQALEIMAGRKALPEGEMHLCWLVEQGLDGTRAASDYSQELKYVITPNPPVALVGDFRFINASWQQRAEALRRIKGVT